jgi:multimeric flavodoxin WrbA
MKILVAFYSETGNTTKIAGAIRKGLSAMGREADLLEIPDARPWGEPSVDTLNAYDLVFLCSPCHDADLAEPVKQVLERLPVSPSFKLAGFVTHASYTPEGGERQQAAYEVWASRCALSFRRASQEKGIDFLGYYGCMGAPSPPIERFIRSTILTDEEEWEAYIREARGHPSEDDLRKAREFGQEVQAKL